MVIALILPIAVVGLLLIFKDQIKAFIDDLQTEKTPEEVTAQEEQDSRGAIENTTRFIFGEDNVDAIRAQEEKNKIAIDKFLTDSQKNIDQAIAGVNTNLVTAQTNLETFANESKANIGKTINDLQNQIDTGVKGIQEGIDTSIKGTQESVNVAVGETQDFFGNIFNNIFGGQQQVKPVTQKTPAPNTTAPKVTISPTSTAPDLSFLTPNTSFTTTIQPKIEEETEIKATTDRTSRTTRFS